MLAAVMLVSALASVSAVPAFAEDGEQPLKQGLSFDADGSIRFYVDGEPVAAGLVEDDRGRIYFINATKCAVRGTYYVPEEMTNGLVPAGYYQFNTSSRRMTVKNGVYANDWLGYTYLYENGVAQANGIYKDSKGRIYFFTTINGINRAVMNGDAYVSPEAGNGILPEGTYHFDRHGWMTGESDVDLKPGNPPEAVPGEGLWFDADGRIRYYENGVSVAAGLRADNDGNLY